MPNYVKIPREIIYDKDLGDKRVIIFSYLCARRALDDTVAFSTTELCNWSNLKPNYRDGKINQKYYETLLLLSHYGYFTECPDFEKCMRENTNSDKYRKLALNNLKFDIPDNFGIIYFDEIDKIINFKSELKDTGIDTVRMSSAYILLVLSYLRVNMNRTPSKPLCCYRHYGRISDDIGLSAKYVSKVVEILDYLDIIKYKPMRRQLYKNSDGKEKFNTTPKIFADYRKFTRTDIVQKIDVDYDYKKEIQKQIEILENNIM